MAETSQTQLFEALARHRVSRQTVQETISWSSSRLFKVFRDVQGATREGAPLTHGVFNFVANDSLSGRAVPFATPETRLTNVTQLARFAALYADTLLIRDPFEAYPRAAVARAADGTESVIGRDLESGDFDDPRLRRRLVDDLRLMFFLRPLFDTGLLGFCRSSMHWCPSCIRILADRGELPTVFAKPSEIAWQRRVAKVVKHIEDLFLKKGTTLVHQHGDHSHVTLTVPPGLLEYDQAQLSVDLPERIAQKAVEPAKLNLRDARKLAVFAPEIDRIVDDISTQNAAANRFGCQYITDRALDLQLMNLVSDRRARSFNKAAAEALTHSVGFIENVPLDRILKIRQDEGEAFQVYRDAVRKLLLDAQGKTTEELREAFDDQVRPELHRIDLTIKSTRRLALTSAVNDVIVLSASVSLAAFSGLLPPHLQVPTELLNVGAALGGWQGVRGLVSKVAMIRSVPKEVAENKFVFLWKLRREVRT